MNTLNEASTLEIKINKLKELLPHETYVQRYDDIISYLAKYMPLTAFVEFEGMLNNTLLSDEDVDFTLKMLLKKAPKEFDPEISEFYVSRARKVPSVMMYASYKTPDGAQGIFIDCVILYDKGAWKVLSTIDVRISSNFFITHKSAFTALPKPPGKTFGNVDKYFKTPTEALRFITPIWDDLLKIIKDNNLNKV